MKEGYAFIAFTERESGWPSALRRLSEAASAAPGENRRSGTGPNRDSGSGPG